MDRIEETQQGTLRDFLYVLFKHKSKILIIFFSIVVTVTVGSFIMDPTYEATSKILVKFGRENIYAATTQSSGRSRSDRQPRVPRQRQPDRRWRFRQLAA